MRWFKSDKDKNDEAGASSARSIHCPHCDFEQEVSAKVELTFCKNCSKIINTKQLKEQAPKAASPFTGGYATGEAKPMNKAASEEKASTPAPAPEEVAEEVAEEAPKATPAPKPAKKAAAPAKPKMFSKPQKPAPTVISDEPVMQEEAAPVMENKEVVCSHCKTSQQVPAIALSSFCKKCGQRINLQDYEIKGKFQGELETRGIICIAEGADVTAEMNVGSAIISGKLRGNIVSESKVEIKETGIIFGTITSPVLLVDDGAIFVGKAIINPK